MFATNLARWWCTGCVGWWPATVIVSLLVLLLPVLYPQQLAAAKLQQADRLIWLLLQALHSVLLVAGLNTPPTLTCHDSISVMAYDHLLT